MLYCNSPETFTFDEVKAAYGRISDTVYKTPLELSQYLSDENTNFYYKLECLQTVKSFKIRGALNKIRSLTEIEKDKGVATISSGNHGASVSYGAKLCGIKNAYVIVPETTPQSKVDKIIFYGGEVLRMGKNYDEAHSLGMSYIKEQEMTYIDPYYDDFKTYGGQGTISIEILEQNPDIDTIVVPVGGGGLITGIAVAAKALKPNIEIIGVQTEACPAMIKAYEDGVFYEEYESEESLCDSLIGGIGALSYSLCDKFVDKLIAVSEKSIAKAVAFLAKNEKIIAEAGSATVVAAVKENREIFTGKNVALIISGGNIDGELLARLLNEN